MKHNKKTLFMKTAAIANSNVVLSSLLSALATPEKLNPPMDLLVFH